MKIKKSLMLASILLVLLAVIYYARINSPIQRRVALFNFPHESVTMISFSNKDDSLFIRKDSMTNEWHSEYPLPIRLNQNKMRHFFDKVMNIQRFDRLLTSNPKDYSFYKVTQATGTRMVLYDSQMEILDDYFFGLADLLSYGAARKASSYHVYELSTNIDYDINPLLANWREQDIIKFSRHEADSIFVKFTLNEYTLKKEEHQWFYEDSTDSFQLYNIHRTFTSCLSQLENLRTFLFIDNQWEENKDKFDHPILSITIYHSDGRIDDLVFALYDDNNSIVMVNGKKDSLYNCTYSTVNRFTKSTETFKNDIFTYSL